MFAIRQIIEDPQDVIAIPPELRHRRTEVIFIALDQGDEPSAVERQAGVDAIDAFRGNGKGGTVAALLADRKADREREG